MADLGPAESSFEEMLDGCVHGGRRALASLVVCILVSWILLHDGWLYEHVGVGPVWVGGLWILWTVIQSILLAAWIEKFVGRLRGLIGPVVVAMTLWSCLIYRPVDQLVLVLDAAIAGPTDVLAGEVCIARWYRDEYRGLEFDPVTGGRMGPDFMCSQMSYKASMRNPYYSSAVELTQWFLGGPADRPGREVPTRMEALKGFSNASSVGSLSKRDRSKVLEVVLRSRPVWGEPGRVEEMERYILSCRVVLMKERFAFVELLKPGQGGGRYAAVDRILCIEAYDLERKCRLGEYAIFRSETEPLSLASVGWLGIR